MSIIITIENKHSKVTIQMDDNQPVQVETSPPANKEQGSEPSFARTNANKGNLEPAKETSITPATDEKPVVKKPLDLNKAAVDVAKYQAKKLAENVVENKTPAVRNCEVCNDDISELDKRRKICLKTDCRKEADRRYAREWYQKKHGVSEPANRITKPVTRQETAPLAVTPQFMPGYEKSPEEIEALRPKPLNLPEAPVLSGGVRVNTKKEDGSFADPWDCQVCRNAGDLCTLHESMAADGKTPPPPKKGVPGLGSSY